MKPGFGVWVARVLRLIGARDLAARLLSRAVAGLNATAERWLAQGRFAEAAACYELVRDLAGPEPVVLGNLAACYRECGRYAEAIACCRHGLTLAPDDPVLHNNMALCLEESGHFELALEHYARAIASQDASPVFAMNHAACLAGIGAGAEPGTPDVAARGVRPAT
ncbi:MAG: tetratricopeptide repeat protein [Desulfotomaculales bacterium]